MPHRRAHDLAGTPRIAGSGVTLLTFLGNAGIALLLATIASFVTPGAAHGFTRDDVLRWPLPPTWTCPLR